MKFFYGIPDDRMLEICMNDEWQSFPLPYHLQPLYESEWVISQLEVRMLVNDDFSGSLLGRFWTDITLLARLAVYGSGFSSPFSLKKM